MAQRNQWVLGAWMCGWLLASGGCGRGDLGQRDRPPPARIFDSAGVRIVELRDSSVGALPEWALGPPSLSIGEVYGEDAYQLSTSVDARRLSDGRLAILDRTARELRLFDQAGVHVATVGREGDGPGEFQRPAFLTLLPGDSLLVYDSGHRRGSVFGPGLTLASERVDAGGGECPVRPGRGRTCSVVGGLPGRRVLWVIEESVGGREIPSVGWLPRFQFLFGVSDYERMTLVDSVYQPDQYYAAYEVEVRGERQPTFGAFPKLLAGLPSWAIGGSGWAYGQPDDSSATIRSDSGAVAAIVRFTWSTRAVTDEDVARYREFFAPDGDEGLEIWLSRDERAERMPYYDKLLLDGLDRLWVRSYEPAYITSDSLPRKWRVIDLERGPVARVTLPGSARFRILQIGDSWVLASERGEFDVLRVVLRPLG